MDGEKHKRKVDYIYITDNHKEDSDNKKCYQAIEEKKKFFLCKIFLFFSILRLMLGMRWWIEIDWAGDEQWVFESRVNHERNKMDERIFWFS